MAAAWLLSACSRSSRAISLISARCVSAGSSGHAGEPITTLDWPFPNRSICSGLRRPPYLLPLFRASARGVVEHPRWDLQPAIRVRPAQRATENNTTGLVDRPMDANAKAKPRMPSIQKLTKASPVGVLKPCCTTISGCILLWPRMHRLSVLFDGSVTSPRDRYSADYIMNTAGRSFWQGQLPLASAVHFVLARCVSGL